MRRSLVLVIGWLAACGPRERQPASASASAIEETCRTTVVPKNAERPPAPPVPPVPPSRLIAHVDMRLAPIAQELDARVPRRVADERNRGIGMAGHLNYTVDRGPFAIAIEGDAMLVRTELRGHAEACANGRCYASCDPVAVATAAVPLRLTPEWRFAPSRVSVAFTRGCQVRALGGFVRVDVTPTIEGQLGPALRNVEKEIDARLPQPRPQAERLWKELSAPRSLPLGSCVVVNPRGIVQGPVTGLGSSLRVRFGLVASPELRTRCGDPPAAVPLPPLAHDPRLPAEDDLVVAMVSPIANAMASLAPSEPFDLDGSRVRITRATAVSAGAALDVDLSLRGEACGDLATRTPLAWTDDGKAIRFTSPELAAAPPLTPALSPDALRDVVPQLASSLSDPTVDVKATIKEAKPLAAYARGDDLAATVRLRGTVDIAQR